MFTATFSENFKGISRKKFDVISTKTYVGQYTTLLVSPDVIKEVCTLKLYCDKNGSNVHALFWLYRWDNGARNQYVGYGKAGGWGYHKASAAAAYSFESAGINLSEALDGRGDGAIRDALLAIAKISCIKGRYIKDIREGDTMGQGRYRLQLVEAFA